MQSPCMCFLHSFCGHSVQEQVKQFMHTDRFHLRRLKTNVFTCRQNQDNSCSNVRKLNKSVYISW